MRAVHAADLSIREVWDQVPQEIQVQVVTTVGQIVEEAVRQVQMLNPLVTSATHAYSRTVPYADGTDTRSRPPRHGSVGDILAEQTPGPPPVARTQSERRPTAAAEEAEDERTPPESERTGRKAKRNLPPLQSRSPPPHGSKRNPAVPVSTCAAAANSNVGNPENAAGIDESMQSVGAPPPVTLSFETRSARPGTSGHRPPATNPSIVTTTATCSTRVTFSVGRTGGSDEVFFRTPAALTTTTAAGSSARPATAPPTVTPVVPPLIARVVPPIVTPAVTTATPPVPAEATTSSTAGSGAAAPEDALAALPADMIINADVAREARRLAEAAGAAQRLAQAELETAVAGGDVQRQVVYGEAVVACLV